ncbi:MAG: bifunctional metallophosphatase/5'-nucleotidase [Armatimonadota bacterium]
MLSPRNSMKWLTLLCVIASVCISHAAFAVDQPQSLVLTILYTNDVHGDLLPFDYAALGKSETNVGGAARRATLIRKIKCEAKNPVLVMDAGDVFARGPMQDLEGEPDFAVMNAVPYDILTLGNNEFKGDQHTGKAGPRGLEILRERLNQAKFAVISANVIDNATGKTLVAPYHVFEKGGVRIGVFGLTAPRTATYPQAIALTFSDPVLTAKKMVAQLKDKCDFIIALTHIGYPLDIMLASSVPGIQVIIGGDSHTWLFQPTKIGGAIICQDGEWGKTLGRLDVSLCRAEDGHYSVSKYEGKLIDIDSSIAPAKDIEEIIRRYVKPNPK